MYLCIYNYIHIYIHIYVYANELCPFEKYPYISGQLATVLEERRGRGEFIYAHIIYLYIYVSMCLHAKELHTFVKSPYTSFIHVYMYISAKEPYICTHNILIYMYLCVCMQRNCIHLLKVNIFLGSW